MTDEIDLYADESIEDKVKRLEDELNATPGAEARAICWTDLFGIAMDANKFPHMVKINMTVRSDIGPEHAFDTIMAGIRHAKSFKMFPYPVDMTTHKPETAKATAEKPATQPVQTTAPAPANSTPAPVSTPTMQATPAPAPAGTATQQTTSSPAEPGNTLKVVSISHAVSPNGNHFILVKAGRYTKHGVSAWPDPGIIPAEASKFTEWPIGQLFQPFPSMTYCVTDGKKVSEFKAQP